MSGLDEVLAQVVIALDRHVRDESRYLLCLLDLESDRLQFYITGESKEILTPAIAQTSISKLKTHEQNQGDIGFAITDYLSTSSMFTGFSLIAILRNQSTGIDQLL